MPFRHLAYSLYACNSNMFNMLASPGISTGAGVVRHCSSSTKDHQPPIALPPTKKLAIVTCMDARINPFTQLGIKPGEAHIIRNAGGMARDALRSLVISQRLLGTREIAVYHHTGCGMATFSKPYLRTLVTENSMDEDKQSIPQASESSKPTRGSDSPLLSSLKSEVDFLRTHPLILRGTKISGWVWDIGKEEAIRII
ncbi:carbonic anhydrase [Lentinula raphanica]|nr:carbonic anhydrase [Lentinula raphanica]